MDKNSSKEEVVKALRRDGNLIRFANPDFKKDFDVLMTAVKNNGTSLYYADKILKDNDDIVINAVKKNGLALKYASERLKNKEHIVELAVKNNGDSLEYASELLRGNENIVKLAVSQYGQAIRYANDSLRKNKEIITIAVKNRGSSLSYLDKSFQDDEEIVMKAIKNNGAAIKYASSRLQNSRLFALAAVEQSGYAYEYIGITQKKDRQITLQAIKNGFPYDELDTEFKNDYEIALEAAKRGISYEDLGQKLKNNKEFLIESVLIDEYIYEELPEKWKNDKDIILAAVKKSPKIYKDLTQENKDDYDIALATLTNDGRMLEYVPIEMKSNEEIVFIALTKRLNVFHVFDLLSYASDSIIKNVEFIVKVLRTLNNEYLFLEKKLNELKEMNEDIFCDKKFFLGLIDLDERIIDSACDKLKNDENFINELLTKSNYAFKYGSKELKNDKDLIITILDTHPYLMNYMGDKLKEDEKLAFIAVTKYKFALNFFSKGLNHNRELVIQSLKSFPKRSDVDFEYYNEDKEIMLYYVKNHENSLVNVSDTLKNDLEIVVSAIENDPYSIQHASLDIQNNRDIVLNAVSKNGSVLKYILPHFLSDKEIVSTAVSSSHGWIEPLEFASDSLKKDKEVVSKALQNSIFSINYVDKSVLEDLEFLASEILNNFNLLSVLPKQYFTTILKKKLVFEIIKTKKRFGDYHPFNDFYYLPSLNSNTIISLESTSKKSFFPQNVVLKFEDEIVGKLTEDYSEFTIMMDSYDDDKGLAKFYIDGFDGGKSLFFGAYPISYSAVDRFAENLQIIDMKQHNKDLYILLENNNLRFSFYNSKIAEIINDIDKTCNNVENIPKNTQTNQNSLSQIPLVSEISTNQTQSNQKRKADLNELETTKPSKKEGLNIKKEYTIKDVIEAAKSLNTDLLEEILQLEPTLEDLGFNQMIDLGFYEMPIAMMPFYELFREEEDVTERTIKVLDLFIKRGMDINIERSDGNNLLTMLGYGIGQVRRSAKKDSRIKIAKYLINQGINAKKKNIYDADFIDILNYDADVQKEYKEIISQFYAMINGSLSVDKKIRSLQDEESLFKIEDIRKLETNKSDPYSIRIKLSNSLIKFPTAIDFLESITEGYKENLSNAFKASAKLKKIKSGYSLTWYSPKTEDDIVLIPSYVTKIAKDAFNGNQHIKALIFEEGVTEIEFGAFENCSNLETVLFPESLKKLEGFRCNNYDNSNKNIKNIYIPSNLKELFFLRHLEGLEYCEISALNKKFYSIDGNVYLSKKNRLTYLVNVNDNGLVEVPDKTIELNIYLISEIARNKIKKIIIPKSVKTIRPFTTEELTVEELQVSSDNPNFTSVEGVIFSKDLSELIWYPENKIGNSYTIPRTTSKIGECSFWKLRNLKILNIPNTVTEVQSFLNSLNKDIFTYDENIDKWIGFEVNLEHSTRNEDWDNTVFELFSPKYGCSID